LSKKYFYIKINCVIMRAAIIYLKDLFKEKKKFAQISRDS